MTYTRTWGQMFTRAKPGSAIGQVGEVIGHTEAGADLPASASVAQEIQRVRAIDAYHRSLGWAGFGYSAFAAQSGRVYEGRGYRRSGAHTVGRNSTALAFVVPGHGDRTPMSAACIAGVIGWIGDGVAAGHIRTRPKVSGHRDYARKSCPGNRIYPQLSQLANITGVPAPPEEDDVTPEESALLAAIGRQVLGDDEQPARQRPTSGRPTLRDMVFNVDGNLRAGDNVRKQYVYVEELGQALRNGQLTGGAVDAQQVADRIIEAIGDEVATSVADELQRRLAR